MAIIKPFRSLRPAKGKEREVAALPYDVLSTIEAKEEKAQNQLTFLQVEKPEIDFDGDINPNSPIVHQRGAQNLKKMVEHSILVRDKTPSFYLYRQIMGSHSQIGIVAATAVFEYDDNIIKRHENTRVDKEDERTNHINTINANTGPVFLTYHHKNEIDNFVTNYSLNNPVSDFTSVDKISHTIWIIDKEADINKLIEMFCNVPCLYVADGHHRSAAASRVSAMQRGNESRKADRPYNYFLSVIFPDNQMKILPYNRVIKELNNLSAPQLLGKLYDFFDMREVSYATDANPKRQGEFFLYLDRKWYSLIIKKDYIPINDPVNSLDAAILQNLVLKPIFGIEDPRKDKRIDFVGGRGLSELEARCKTDCKIAFALYPTSIRQLMDVADGGNVMPPKSTWFEPKLRSGLFVRMLD